MEKLIEKFLGVVEIVLDQCINYSDLLINYFDFMVFFNFFFLDLVVDLIGYYYFFGLVFMVKYC